jgi:hypothetical protein
MNLCTSWDSLLPPKTSTTSDLHMYPYNLTTPHYIPYFNNKKTNSCKEGVIVV